MKYSHSNSFGRYYQYPNVLEAQTFVQITGAVWIPESKYVRINR